MTNIELQLKNKIMRRVYATWLLRKIISVSFARFLFLAGVIAEFAREVSVVDVFRNVPGGSIFSSFNYFSFAFSHTELSVQLYILGIFIIVVWFFSDSLFRKSEYLNLTGSRFTL